MNEKEIVQKLVEYPSGGSYFLLYKIIKENSSDNTCELTQQELADLLKKTRKVISEGLVVLSELGLIEFSYKNIKLLGDSKIKLKKPKCEMNYIGSKFKLLDFIYKTILEDFSEEEMKKQSFCDLFSGTGIVSRFFKNKTKKVISNDLEYYSYIMLKAYMSNDIDIKKMNEILKESNKLKGTKKHIFNHYSENGSAGRLYFSEKNGQKIDSIRNNIDKLEITEEEKGYLLTSLIEASDKVANTASVYGAYLKAIKKTALKDIELTPLDWNLISKQKNLVYNEDANELIKQIKGNILYLDPPYNHREYGANYHLLTTIAKYDFADFVPAGVTGMRPYTRSNYTKKVKVKASFDELIKNAKFDYIYLSYNNEGILTLEEIKEVMEKYGEYKIKTLKYPRFKADSNRNNKSDFVYEYLHVLKKNGI